MKKNFSIDFHAISDIGKSRVNNEDLFTYLKNINFFVIADGMGGHKAGEIAAKEASYELCRYIEIFFYPQKNISLEKIKHYFHFAINQANKKVFLMGEKNIQFKGMGTTLSCLYIQKNIAIFAHVGDSRIYLIRNNQIIQITKDHSITEKKTDYKNIEKIKNVKNIITKAIGITKTITPDIKHEKIYSNDIYLMCTDGLSDYIDKKEILSIIKNEKILKKEAVQKLIEQAKKNGSKDNITTAILEIK